MTNFFSAAGLTDAHVAAQVRLAQKASPIGLMGEPNDIADLVLYIASDDAKYMTGTAVGIDGGTLISSASLNPADAI